MRSQIEIMTKNSIFSTIYYQKSPPGGSRTKNYNQCSQGCMGEYGFDFLVKTPGHYQVVKLSNLKHMFKIFPNLSKFVETLYNKKVFAYFYSKIVVFGKFSIFPTKK